MRFFIPFLFLIMTLSAGCTGELEKYVTSNKGVMFVYGRYFAFTSFKPAGWVSDRLVTTTNRMSMFLRPSNRTDIRLFAYGIVLTNRGTNQSDLAEDDMISVYRDESPKNPGLKWELVPSTAAIDKSGQTIRYRFDGIRKGKGFYQESVYVLWDKAMVIIAMRTENPALIAEGGKQLDRFIASIKYWGADSDGLSHRVVKTFFRKK